MVNINVRELDRVYNNDNVYYRCHIKCDCNNRTKTFYHEKVMKADEELHFTDEELMPLHQIKIISYKDKANWQLEAKYTIGNKYTSYE
jgi:hypothetical protein